MTQLWIGQNGPIIRGQNATLDEMYVSVLASMAGTKCHKEVDIKYALDNMSQMQCGCTDHPFFVDDMSGFGVNEQSVHFHVCLGCSVNVDVVYMGRKIEWTIHAGRSFTRKRCT